jgi:hypothetical protein
MKVIYSKNFPAQGFVAITLGFFVFARKEFKPLSDLVIRHEGIHVKQQLEMLILPFFLWYGIEYLVRAVQYGDFHTAYRNISFEREAYANQDILDYKKKRKFFAWIKYLRN